jgi:phosphatidylglycerophosphate synthase
MDRRPLKTRSHAWTLPLARGLLEIGLRPNHVSLSGIGFAGVAAWCLATRADCWGCLLSAAVCIQLRLLCNMLDGLMAVEGGAGSKTGDLFNEVPDRVEDALILTAAGYGAGIPAAGWLATTLAMLTAYLRAFGGSLGLPQDFCGPGAKPHRMFVMTLGCLLAAGDLWINGTNRVLGPAVWFVGGLAAVTAVRRLERLHRSLSQR